MVRVNLLINFLWASLISFAGARLQSQDLVGLFRRNGSGRINSAVITLRRPKPAMSPVICMISVEISRQNLDGLFIHPALCQQRDQVFKS